MSSFLYKETNFTKLGKMLRGKRWNSYSQMLKSIVHSLRLEPDEEHMHIIKSRTKDNVILSKVPIEELMAYVELTIAKNIKKYEKITMDESERKKLFKDFTNAKAAIAKKIPLELLDEAIQHSNDAQTVLENLITTHSLPLKSTDKRTLSTLQRYMELQTAYLNEKVHQKYNNQVLLKEILFKIPANQPLNLSNEQWESVVLAFKEQYFPNYEMFFAAIHNDEGTEEEIKGHVHLFLSGFSDESEEFDIKKDIFQMVKAKHNLDADFNNTADHQKVMDLFQDDFYEFFNFELGKMGIKERIELKEYQTLEEMNQRLCIQKEDHLTIDEKHEKLANKILLEKMQEYDQFKGYEGLTCELSENLFSNSLTLKTNLKYKSDNPDLRVTFFSKLLQIGLDVSKYFLKMTKEIADLKDALLGKTLEIGTLERKLKDTEEDYKERMRLRDKFAEDSFGKKLMALEDKVTLRYTHELKDAEATIASQAAQIKDLTLKNSVLLEISKKCETFEKLYQVNIAGKIREFYKAKQAPEENYDFLDREIKR